MADLAGIRWQEWQFWLIDLMHISNVTDFGWEGAEYNEIIAHETLVSYESLFQHPVCVSYFSIPSWCSSANLR